MNLEMIIVLAIAFGPLPLMVAVVLLVARRVDEVERSTEIVNRQKVVYGDIKPIFLFWLRWIFPAYKSPGAVMTFNGKIYASDRYPIRQDIFVHELVHLKQQGRGLSAWLFLFRYILDKKFRYKMELAAYREQLAYILATYEPAMNSAEIHYARNKMAGAMSGGAYGNMVSHSQAYKDLVF